MSMLGELQLDSLFLLSWCFCFRADCSCLRNDLLLKWVKQYRLVICCGKYEQKFSMNE